MSTPDALNVYNRRTQELLQAGIAILEASRVLEPPRDGDIQTIQVQSEHRTSRPSKLDHILTLHLGGAVARRRVVKVVGAKLGQSIGSKLLEERILRETLAPVNVVDLDTETQLCLNVPSDYTIRHEQSAQIRKIENDNMGSPDLAQASTLIGALPFEITNAKLTLDGVVDQNDMHYPELEISTARLSLMQLRIAMVAFGNLVTIPNEDDSITHSKSALPNTSAETWQGTSLDNTGHILAVMAHFQGII